MNHSLLKLIFWVSVCFGCFLSCSPEVSSQTQKETEIVSTEKQPKDEKKQKLYSALLNQNEIKLEFAKTPQEHALGLMFRKSMPTHQGMLFVFKKEQTLSFWMKNTLIPLSIAYLDKNLVIIDIQNMKAQDLTPHPSLKPSQYALEMNQNWFEKNGVKVGTSLKIKKELLIS